MNAASATLLAPINAVTSAHVWAIKWSDTLLPLVPCMLFTSINWHVNFNARTCCPLCVRQLRYVHKVDVIYSVVIMDVYIIYCFFFHVDTTMKLYICKIIIFIT